MWSRLVISLFLAQVPTEGPPAVRNEVLLTVLDCSAISEAFWEMDACEASRPFFKGRFAKQNQYNTTKRIGEYAVFAATVSLGPLDPAFRRNAAAKQL